MTNEIDTSDGPAGLPRYRTPCGHGVAQHPLGLLYMCEDVDPIIDALLARAEAAEAKLAAARSALSVVRRVLDSLDGLTAAQAARVASALALLDAPTRPAPETVEEAGGGVAAIAAERQRQMDVEGWTPEHDDMHYDDELACAAICYLRHSPDLCAPEAPPDWPWDERWWKPKSRRADLVRAGALVAAEIDRIDRAALRTLAGERKDG